MRIVCMTLSKENCEEEEIAGHRQTKTPMAFSCNAGIADKKTWGCGLAACKLVCGIAPPRVSPVYS